MSKKVVKKPPLYFYIVLILIPILFFVLLETALRFSDYGYNTKAFIEYSDTNPDLLFVNGDLPYRYVSSLSRPPAVSLDAFQKIKTDSSFRIFVMGGSSTAGFPYAYNATFPKYLERKLKLLYPAINIEVINLGITAHNSYTIADLADDVVAQKPDLVIVYAGHNEYYGVLGVGSSASFGSSVSLTKLMISLNQLKTYQLLKNFMSWAMELIGSNEESVSIENETLMSLMIGESKILYDSQTYNDGIEQFNVNMMEFIETIRDNDINMLIGNIVSNYNQKPFVSVKGEEQLAADSLFSIAEENEKDGDIKKAKENFILAKEYDALRFRAPEKINTVIRKLCDEYNIMLVDIKQAFEKSSRNEIIDYDLMVDHLHPNIDGYNLIGNEFFEVMKEANYLPEFEVDSIVMTKIDSIMAEDFPFTKFDSLLADIRLKKLLGSYPFVQKGKRNKVYQDFKPQNFIDSLVISVLAKKMSWRSAHQEAANWYFKQGNIKQFVKEMKTIIAYQPYAEIPYVYAASRLVAVQKFDDALFFLEKVHKLNANDYTYKWIGSIALEKKDFNKSVDYLRKSAELNNKDAQVHYNLSGAYFNLGDIDNSINSIKRCLELNKNYPRAEQFYNALIQAYGAKN